jgi:hypothetical protein
VCGELHVVGGIRSVWSIVGEGARVGLGGEVRVMLPCYKSCQSIGSFSIVLGVLMLCFNESCNPCSCVCRSRAFCLQKWTCVLGLSLVINVLELPETYSML